MLNRSILIGRLTKDPELKYLPNGTAVSTFTIAVDRPFSKDGEKEADFIPIVTWKQLAENCANYLRKGRLCAVEGRIQVRNWEKDGKRHYTTEVVADNVRFLESPNSVRGGTNGGTAEDSQGSISVRRDPFADDGRSIEISADDLPF